MIYQLASGKIIYITVDQFLALSDEELDALGSTGIGEYAKSPWVGSAIKKPTSKISKEDQEEMDRSIDYIEDSEELGGEKPIITDEVFIEEIPEPEDNPEQD